MSRVRLPLPCFFAGADRSLRSGIPGIPTIQGIAGGIAGAPLSFLFGQVALKLILLGSTWPPDFIKTTAGNPPQWPAARRHPEETRPVATLRNWHRH